MPCEIDDSKKPDDSKTRLHIPPHPENSEVCRYVGAETQDDIFRMFIQKIIESSSDTDHEILYFPFTKRIEYSEIRFNRTMNVDFEKT